MIDAAPASPHPPDRIERAYARCRELARRHYENFPVASRLLPASLRDPVAAIYAFARGADDFADEPQFRDDRLPRLEAWGAALERAAAGRAEDEVFIALADTIARHRLPLAPFRDLLSAFRQDCLRQRYDRWEEVLDYCRRSADPVGRLMLHLFDHRDPDLHPASDALCTALQLTNFWQDLAVDAGRGRIYVPREDLRRHAVSEASLLEGRGAAEPGFVPLMEELAARTEALFARSSDFAGRVGGRLGFQIRLTWLGGRRILAETRRRRFDVFRSRPALSTAAWGALALRACLPGSAAGE